jgi:hypothetical protein
MALYKTFPNLNCNIFELDESRSTIGVTRKAGYVNPSEAPCDTVIIFSSTSCLPLLTNIESECSVQ